jgi:GAF domain-containing protein
MSEQKQQNGVVPLRVRLRSTSEHPQLEREHTAVPARPSNGGYSMPHPHTLHLPTENVPQQHTRQIKELIRLGNMLRAELGLEEVLQDIVTSISACTGFRIASINLIDEESGYLVAVALTGSSPENERLILERRISVEQILRVMRPEYRMSHSYFVSHEHSDQFADIPRAVNKSIDDYQAGGWHPEDALIVPLFSPRKKKLLGFLALDDPVSGKIPTVENIEMVELFANQAALAIDNAHIFQEREAERIALEEAIVLLRQNLEPVQHGDLRVRVQSAHEKLQPIVEAINIMIEEISGILGSVQMVTQAVDEHAQDVQRNSDLLVRDTGQQERQVHSISQVIDDMANTMHQVSERAEEVSRVAVEAMDVTIEGQNKVVRESDGMREVIE